MVTETSGNGYALWNNIDPTSMLLGWLTGERVKAMLRSKREPVAYLYNGVRLPPFPRWDKTKYPYAVLSLPPIGWYTLKAWASLPPTYMSSGKLYIGNKSSDSSPIPAYGSYYNPESGKVADGSEESYTNILLDAVFWANFDVYTEDGALYLAASEPVPVYE